MSYDIPLRISEEDLANLLLLSRQQLRSWVSKGKLPKPAYRGRTGIRVYDGRAVATALGLDGAPAEESPFGAALKRMAGGTGG